jgi:hypothetical protein
MASTFSLFCKKILASQSRYANNRTGTLAARSSQEPARRRCALRPTQPHDKASPDHRPEPSETDQQARAAPSRSNSLAGPCTKGMIAAAAGIASMHR